MHLSEIINPINLVFTLLVNFSALLFIRKWLFVSLQTTISVLKEQITAYEKKFAEMTTESIAVKEKDRLTDRRMLEAESAINRFKLQTQLHRDEIEMLGAALTRCMPIILSQANGQKDGIEDAMRQIADYRTSARQKMIDFDDEQRVWRIWEKQPD